MPAAFPHSYEVGLSWDSGRGGVLSAPPRPSLLGGPPPQFDGKEEWWSPEHLLLASANLCLMSTFLAVAEKSRLAVKGYASRARGTLDRTPEGIVFTAITLNVELRVAGPDAVRAANILATAKKHCIISNSLKKEVALEARVLPAQDPA